MRRPVRWKGLASTHLSRRHLLTDAARVGVGLATLSITGCEEQEEPPTTQEVPMSPPQETLPVSLPPPRLRGDVSLEEAIASRRSRREFSDPPLTLEQVSQILWSAQGVTDPVGLRAAPSAGATYPLKLYLTVGRGGVEGLAEGTHRYVPDDHALQGIRGGDVREEVARLAAEQMFIAEAPATLVIAAEYERTTGKYGDRGVRYVHMEAGHVAQNVYLQAEALGLGTVAVGAFQDEELAAMLALPPNDRPLYLMPIGQPVGA